MIWVFAQTVMFALILLLPFEASYVAQPWMVGASWAAGATGLAILLRAAYDLRASLAVQPKPKADGSLQTKGIYSYIRHPMYVAVWLMLGSGVIRSASYEKYAVFAVLVVFFVIKSRHEERLLVEKYPGYKNYMDRVGAFLPKFLP